MDIEILRGICTGHPHVTEDIKWGNDLCFLIGNKMFCVTSLQTPATASFKVTDEEFDQMSSRPGFQPAPYMARHHWVLVTDLDALSLAEWRHYIRQSYTMVRAKLSKKILKELGE